MQRPRILILGGDADSNLGDRAILMAMCREARASWPRAEITVVSADRARAERDLGARVVPKGIRGLPALVRAAAHSDLVLVGGGGLFQDDDSLVKMPYWGLRVALVRSLCRRVVGYSLGVGPLKAATSRAFARLAFACMEKVSVRDRVAQRVAQPLTGKDVRVVPDPALLLEPAPREEARAFLRAHGVPLDGRPLLGVAPRRWFPPRRRLVPNRISAAWTKRAPESHAWTALLGRALDGAVRRTGARVVFLPTYTLSHEGDDRVAAEIASKMEAPAGPVVRIDDPRLYKAVTGELAALLAGRMHPGILAAGMGTPLVGLAYNRKFHGFFELLGHDAPMDVESFVREQRSAELEARLVAALAGDMDRRRRVTELGREVVAFHRGLGAA